MLNAKLVLNETNMSATASGHVVCGLVLSLETSVFPHPEWTDFAVVVLTWWAEAAERLLSGAPGPIDVRFMEGPFLVTIHPTTTGAWRLRCIDAGLHHRTRHDETIAPGPLVQSILDASTRVLAASRLHIPDIDTPQLQRATPRLQSRSARSSS